MQILSNPISALNICKSPAFTRLNGNLGLRTRWWRQILDRKWKYGHFAHAQWEIRNITLIYVRIAKIFASFRKSGSRNTMVTSDFSPEVEIRPFRACAMHQAIITGTVRSLWTWLWGRYHVRQNAFLVWTLFYLVNSKLTITFYSIWSDTYLYVLFQVTKKMEGVTKALDKAMASMDLEKVFSVFFATRLYDD